MPVPHAHARLGQQGIIGQRARIAQSTRPFVDATFHFAGVDRHHAAGQQCERATFARRTRSGHRHQRIDRVTGREMLTADMPDPIQRAAQHESLLRSTAIARCFNGWLLTLHACPLGVPVNRRLHIGALAPGPLHGIELPATFDPGVDGFGDGKKHVGMRLSYAVRLSALGQRFTGERTDGFEQKIAFSGSHHAHEPFFCQRAQFVERAGALARRVAHGLHLVERPSLRKYRQTSQEALFGGVQQRIAPVYGGAERALTHGQIAVARGKQVERVIESREERRRLENANACGGQFQCQWQSVESDTDCGDGEAIGAGDREAGLHLFGALHEQGNGGRLQ